MRLDPRRTAKNEAVRLFETLYDAGLTTFHSSYEYGSFEYYCKCLAAFREERPTAELQHIVKVPAPHFDEEAFSRQAFSQRIDHYLTALQADRLDVVQWLIRQSPNTYARRARVLEDSRQELGDIWNQLQREGKVGALASFPYDPDFARKVVGLPSCEGLVTYLNLAELEYAVFPDWSSVIAIRPLFAGMLTPAGLLARQDEQDALRNQVGDALRTLGIAHENVAQFAIQFSLMHGNVASTIVGVSSEQHARELLDAVGNLRVDAARFREIAKILASKASLSC